MDRQLSLCQYLKGFTVVPEGQYFALALGDIILARLNKGLCTLLQSLNTQHHVRFHSYVPDEIWDSTESCWHVQPGSQLPIEINIYGNRENAQLIGQITSKVGIFLQFPRHGPEGVEYYNPHFLRMEGYSEQEPIETLRLSSSRAKEPTYGTSDEISQANNTDAVDEILDSLSHQNLLDNIHVDARIKSNLFP